MSLRNLFGTLTSASVGLVEGLAKGGNAISEHLDAYHDDKWVRDWERNIGREKRLEQLAKQAAKCKLTDEDLVKLEERVNRVKALADKYKSEQD